jgi:hypothetical protein
VCAQLGFYDSALCDTLCGALRRCSPISPQSAMAVAWSLSRLQHPDQELVDGARPAPAPPLLLRCGCAGPAG